jgi:hypothetical protein
MPDPNAELAQILTYAQSSAAWINAASALITQLQAASAGNLSTPTDSDSPDVEAAIENILTFQTANPVPATPAAVTNAPSSATTAATSAPSASS